jgi:hypothetical protein
MRKHVPGSNELYHDFDVIERNLVVKPDSKFFSLANKQWSHLHPVPETVIAETEEYNTIDWDWKHCCTGSFPYDGDGMRPTRIEREYQWYAIDSANSATKVAVSWYGVTPSPRDPAQTWFNLCIKSGHYKPGDIYKQTWDLWSELYWHLMPIVQTPNLAEQEAITYFSYHWNQEEEYSSEVYATCDRNGINLTNWTWEPSRIPPKEKTCDPNHKPPYM